MDGVRVEWERRSKGKGRKVAWCWRWTERKSETNYCRSLKLSGSHSLTKVVECEKEMLLALQEKTTKDKCLGMFLLKRFGCLSPCWRLEVIQKILTFTFKFSLNLSCITVPSCTSTAPCRGSWMLRWPAGPSGHNLDTAGMYAFLLDISKAAKRCLSLGSVCRKQKTSYAQKHKS